jgi:hypothetical protein
MGVVAMTDHDLAYYRRIKRTQRSTERERLARTIGTNDPAAPSPPPAPLPYKLPDGPRFAFATRFASSAIPTRCPTIILRRIQNLSRAVYHLRAARAGGEYAKDFDR